MGNDEKKQILITGGCGYVGSVLAPKLARKNKVVVLDSMLFGNHLPDMPDLRVVKGDIRDDKTVRSLLPGITDVIHLASIANDPCSDLNPAITYEVNRDAVASVAKAAKESGVKRFINASSSSVYGVKEEESVTEDLLLEPITLYAKLKAESEEIVGGFNSNDFTTVSVRSATVCAVSPRMRFDVIVNIIAKSALTTGQITVFGGDQYRPNIHIDDITDLYVLLTEFPDKQISGKVFNVGSTNYTVNEIAAMASEVTGASIIVDSNVTDNRSYRISSGKIKQELGFTPRKTIKQSIIDVKNAFAAGVFTDPENSRYYNVKAMKEQMAR